MTKPIFYCIIINKAMKGKQMYIAKIKVNFDYDYIVSEVDEKILYDSNLKDLELQILEYASILSKISQHYKIEVDEINAI